MVHLTLLWQVLAHILLLTPTPIVAGVARGNDAGDGECDAPADHVGDARRRALVRHVRHLYAGHLIEEFDGKALRRALAGSGNAQTAGFAPS